jgi:predicted peptidase
MNGTLWVELQGPVDFQGEYPLNLLMRSFLVLTMMGISSCSLMPVLGEDPSPGKQVEQTLKVGEESLSYLLYLPKNYSAEGNGNSQDRRPLMLFLHGRGESEGPLATVKKWGPPNFIEHGFDFPCIIASPQCPPAPKSWTSPQEQTLLLALLQHLTNAFKVDTDRIYLTGLSMGGYGTWRLAAEHADLFAAAVPICGGGDSRDADKLKYLPIWAWHGAADHTVPAQRSIDMVEAIKKAGSTTIRLTTLEGIGHVSWQAAYASPDVWQWLDGQSASKNRARARQP